MKYLFILLLISYPICSFLVHSTKHPSVNGTENRTCRLMITDGQSLLKEGDLVVRLNRDPVSRFIKYVNRKDQSYSHAGIVLFEQGYPYIFHIVNGEENPDERLRKDSLGNYCNPRKNISYGIFRYDIRATEIKKLKELIHTWYDKGVQFDSAFNLKTDDRMYCSEMVSKALCHATAKRISIETTRLTTAEATIFSVYTHLPFSYTNNLSVVAIDALYMNPFCHAIKEFKYPFN